MAKTKQKMKPIFEPHSGDNNGDKRKYCECRPCSDPAEPARIKIE